MVVNLRLTWDCGCEVLANRAHGGAGGERENGGR